MNKWMVGHDEFVNLGCQSRKGGAGLWECRVPSPPLAGPHYLALPGWLTLQHLTGPGGHCRFHSRAGAGHDCDRRRGRGKLERRKYWGQSCWRAGCPRRGRGRWAAGPSPKRGQASCTSTPPWAGWSNRQHPPAAVRCKLRRESAELGVKWDRGGPGARPILRHIPWGSGGEVWAKA